jgi:hypothetical protein
VTADIPPLAHIAVEAAVCRVIGRELDDNPFDQLRAREQHRCWRWSWRYCDELLARVLAHEVGRSLEGEEAA